MLTRHSFAAFLSAIFVSFLGLSLLATPGYSAEEKYPRGPERAALVTTMNSLTPQKLQIDFKSQADPRVKAFLQIFAEEFWPLQAQMETLGEKENLLYGAIDRALYKDKKEQSKWQRMMNQFDHESNAIRTSEKWRGIVQRMGEAAEGLDGDLADLARRAYESQTRAGFEEKELPLLNRLNEIMNEVKTISNSSPVAPLLAGTMRESDAIEAKFVNGTLSFSDAVDQLSALRKSGGAAHGQYIAEKSRELLREAAVIRTKLAQSKGYANWAEFSVAGKERMYAPGYQTPSERILFLQKVLESTKATHRDFLLQRANEVPGTPEALKKDLRGLTSSQASLFMLPTDVLIMDYFPVENVESVWRKTMLDSGFTKTNLDRINLDSYPRDGKQTHAYMLTARGHQPVTFTVDARSLKVKTPRQVAGKWMPALIYIVQNMRSDGTDAYSTAFHEGGHGLDYMYRQDVVGVGQDSSYAETHSMTMEHFFSDPVFLSAMGRTRTGEKIPQEKIEQFLANTAANKLASFRGQALNSLFDLELWNHAYEEGGEDFVARALRIQDEMSDRYMFSNADRFKDGIDSRYARFSTDHFYGGSVRYIGYVYAGIAADMSYKKLLDVLETTTGRRTLLNQPSIAGLLTEGYYKRGFAEPFPRATERFTGVKFDPSAAAELVNSSAETWIRQSRTRLVSKRSCESLFQ